MQEYLLRGRANCAGKALLISNWNYPGFEPLHYIAEQSNIYEHVLGKLQYSITLHENLTASEICELIRALTTDDFSDFDSLTLYFAGKGTASSFYGIDNIPVSLERIAGSFASDVAGTLQCKVKFIVLDCVLPDGNDADAYSCWSLPTFPDTIIVSETYCARRNPASVGAFTRAFARLIASIPVFIRLDVLLAVQQAARLCGRHPVHIVISHQLTKRFVLRRVNATRIRASFPEPQSADPSAKYVDFNYVMRWAMCYHVGGNGVTQDKGRAVRLWEFCADNQHGLAMVYLASCYINGDGVPVDLQRGYRLLEQATEQELDVAFINLGLCLQHGIGCEVDLTRAADQYRLAAAQGDAVGCVHLAHCYSKGQGCKQDVTRAAELYNLAAIAGYAPAQYLAGMCHFNGRGMPVNKACAVQLFEMATKLGEPRAQFRLGECYIDGLIPTVDGETPVEHFSESVLRALRLHAGKAVVDRITTTLRLNQAARECLEKIGNSPIIGDARIGLFNLLSAAAVERDVPGCRRFLRRIMACLYPDDGFGPTK